MVQSGVSVPRGVITSNGSRPLSGRTQSARPYSARRQSTFDLGVVKLDPAQQIKYLKQCHRQETLTPQPPATECAKARRRPAPQRTSKQETCRPVSGSSVGMQSAAVGINTPIAGIEKCQPVCAGSIADRGSVANTISAAHRSNYKQRRPASANSAASTRVSDSEFVSIAHSMAKCNYDVFLSRHPVFLTTNTDVTSLRGAPQTDRRRRVPASFLPSMSSIRDKAIEQRLSLDESAASLLVGQQFVDLWKSSESRPCLNALNSGVLDLKYWMNHACNQWSNCARQDVQATSLIVSLFLLHGLDCMAACDISAWQGMLAAPEGLRVLPGLSALNLSNNHHLESILPLRACSGLKALDLSDCPKLTNLSPLQHLSSLEAVDLARCTSLKDVTPLWSRTHLMVDQATATLPGQSAAEPKTNSRLRWLSLSCCAKLRSGVSGLKHCQALAYIDLFDCNEADVCECYVVSQAPHVKTFVWPGSPSLQSLVRDFGLHEERFRVVTCRAHDAVKEKLALASAGDRAPGLPRQAEAPRGASFDAAWRALQQFEDGSSPQISSRSPSEQQSLSSGSSPHRRKKKSPTKTKTNHVQKGPRITPLVFTKALRSIRFSLPAGIDASDVFRVLDKNGDGVVTEEELGFLLRGPPQGLETDAVALAVLQRHGGSCSAAAADLAGGRATMSKSRIVECLLIAGVTDVMAERAAFAFMHCASGLLPEGVAGNAEVALTHALAAYQVARAARLVDDFKAHVLSNFLQPKDAFAALDQTLTGQVTWEDFRLKTIEQLRWPYASTPGACEAVFKVLDNGSSGLLSLSEFSLIAHFDAETVLAEMVIIGRRLDHFPSMNPICLQDSAEDILDRGEFAVMWNKLNSCESPTDSNVAFGLLDLEGQNFLGRSELLVLSDALPRRAEASALGSLEKYLCDRYGNPAATSGVADWHARLLNEVPSSNSGQRRSLNFSIM